jgi:hypothetical protein
VLGETLAGLDLTGTTHTNAGDYTDDPWTFTDVTGNYNDITDGTVDDNIDKADAVCTVTGYDVTYDSFAHTATGSCKGVLGETLAGLDLTGTTHTNAGDYTDDPWTFTDVTGNYNDITDGTVDDNIDKADAVCTVTPYSVIYDHIAHTATGSCTGVKGENLTGLNLGGTTHTNPGDYPDDVWAFTDVTGNYNNANGTVHDNIHFAPAGMCGYGPGNVILQPINADGSSVWKKRNTVPVKFRVCDASGAAIGDMTLVFNTSTPHTIAAPYLYATQTGAGPVDEPGTSNTPDTQFRWSASDQQWIFNLNTDNLTAGKVYFYHIYLTDGTTIDFKFGLR